MRSFYVCHKLTKSEANLLVTELRKRFRDGNTSTFAFEVHALPRNVCYVKCETYSDTLDAAGYTERERMVTMWAEGFVHGTREAKRAITTAVKKLYA